MTVPTTINVNATGRAGAAYFLGASRIVADSAARESQILASQSALALSAMNNLGNSLSAGLTHYLDYRLAVKQQAFDRDMKTREFQIKEGELDIMRLQAEDLHLSRQQEAQSRDLDLAQKQQAFLMEPQVRKSRAEAAALLSAARGAATKIQSGNYTDEDRNKLIGAHETLGRIAEKMAGLGVPQAEIEQLHTNLAPLVRSASVVTLSDGTDINVTAARQAVLNPASPIGRKVLVDFLVNPSNLEPVTRRNAEYTRALLGDPAMFEGKGGLDKLLALAGSDTTDPQGARKAAETAYRSMQLMPPRERDALRLQFIEAGGSGDMKAQELNRLRQTLNTNDPRVLVAAVMGEGTPSAPVWQGSPDRAPINPVVPQQLGGSREVEPRILARLGFEGKSVRDYFGGGLSGLYAKTLSGDISRMDATPTGKALSLLGPILGGMYEPAEALERKLRGSDSTTITRAHRETADNYVMLAAQAAQSKDWTGAKDYLEDLTSYLGGVKEYGGGKVDPESVISSESAATIRRIALMSAQQEAARGYYPVFSGWLQANAPKLAPAEIAPAIAAPASPLAGAPPKM